MINLKGAIKSVQYGTSTSKTITHSPVDVSKSFVILNSQQYNYPYILTSRTGTSFTVAVSSGSYSYSWQLVEFY